jgi:hypothetical protein
MLLSCREVTEHSAGERHIEYHCHARMKPSNWKDSWREKWSNNAIKGDADKGGAAQESFERLPRKKLVVIDARREDTTKDEIMRNEIHSLAYGNERKLKLILPLGDEEHRNTEAASGS